MLAYMLRGGMPRDLTAREAVGLSRAGQHRVSKNLYMQVTPTGTKSWLFRYMRDGRSHGMGLGSLELVTLAKARDKALLCRTMLLDGSTPSRSAGASAAGRS
jgi:hypothetical protein